MHRWISIVDSITIIVSDCYQLCCNPVELLQKLRWLTVDVVQIANNDAD